MLRKFRVRLNDKEYMVEMEELTPGGFQAPAPAAAPAPQVEQASAPATEPAPAPAPQAASSAPGAGEEVHSPMPGTILSVDVAVGDQVAESQVVLVLDAMKMENQIVSPKAGTITSIMVTQGQTVDAGQALFTVE